MTTKLIIPDSYRPLVKIRRRKDRAGFMTDYDLPPQHGEDRVRVRKSIPARNMVEAKRWATEKEQALWDRQFGAYDLRKMRVDSTLSKESRRTTLEEFLPRFRQLRERGRKKPLSPRTIDSQEKIIRQHLVPRFGKVELVDITTTEIDAFVETLLHEDHPLARLSNGRPAGELSPKTINNILGMLGRILTVAYRRELINRKPLIEKLPGNVGDEQIDFLTHFEVKRLFAACQGVSGRMIMAYVLTGCRAMELAGLRWEDYDPKARRLHIKHQIQPYVSGYKLLPPKWNSKRIIPVYDKLAAILNEQAALTRLQDSFIFFSEKGNPYCNELIRNALARTCRRANLRRVSPQVLRRTYVSHLIMAGEHPKKVQELAGHRNFQTTERFYSAIEPDCIQGAAQNLEEWLSKTTITETPVHGKTDSR